MSDLENSADVDQAAPTGGADKARDFASKVRLGMLHQKVNVLSGELGDVNGEWLKLAQKIERIQGELSAIATDLAKERG